MPITYEPSQPFDARVSEAYGASQSRQQAQQMALQAYGITQASSDRASERAQNEEQFNASYRQKFQMQDAAQAHDFAQAQQHVDLQIQANQAQLTQAESMRLQRLQRQTDYAQSAFESGSISRDEFNDITTQLNTGISPLQQKATRAQILQTQAQTRLTDSEAARAATRANQEAAFHARTLSERTRVLLDPTMEAEARAQLDPQGLTFPGDPALQQAIEAEVARRGGATRMFEESAGTMRPLDSGREAREEARRNHIASGIQRISSELRQEMSDYRKPENVANAPAWSRTDEGIRQERQRRIAELHSDVASIFNPPSPRQQTGGQGQQRQQVTTPPVTTAAGTTVPTQSAPRAPITEVNNPSTITLDRTRAVENIANAITPPRHRDATTPNQATLFNNEQEYMIGQRMRNILNTASRENRRLSNTEAADYEDLRRQQLGPSNPYAAAMLSLDDRPTQEQNSFGHSDVRREELARIIPGLRTEANRLSDQRTFFGDTRAHNLARQLATILEPAATRNRQLTAEETVRYLRTWRQLQRLGDVGDSWAKQLALHQNVPARE